MLEEKEIKFISAYSENELYQFEIERKGCLFGE